MDKTLPPQMVRDRTCKHARKPFPCLIPLSNAIAVLFIVYPKYCRFRITPPRITQCSTSGLATAIVYIPNRLMLKEHNAAFSTFQLNLSKENITYGIENGYQQLGDEGVNECIGCLLMYRR